MVLSIDVPEYAARAAVTGFSAFNIFVRLYYSRLYFTGSSVSTGFSISTGFSGL